MGTVTISLEHSDRLYWLGRYTERVFTTLKALQGLYDKMLDQDDCYKQFLEFFEINTVYEDSRSFMRSFLYDKSNQSSVAFSLERAYDNGIVLREEISTEALSFLQLSKDTLAKSENSENTRLSLLPLEDLLFGFWGCIEDYIYNDEIKNIIYCGKSIERLDLYLRMKYPFGEVEKEFQRLCKRLGDVPKTTPYRYNTKFLSNLVEIIGARNAYERDSQKAIISLEHLFETTNEVSA